MSSHRLSVRPLAAALAVLALASPVASAKPIDMSEAQVVASRGVGAPSAAGPYARGFGGARDALAHKQRTRTPTAADPGFDWGALALGAAGASALIAVFAFAVPALGARVRTAR
jgi:hypothetical protein